MITIEEISFLYSEYKEDLIDLHKQQALFYKRFNLKWYQKNRLLNTLVYQGGAYRVRATLNTNEIVTIHPPAYGDLEAEITYLLIRKYKPKCIVEMSPASGWSTSWILSALHDNEVGSLTSFDLVNTSKKMLPHNLTKDRWTLIVGDVKEQMTNIPKPIDFLFIDSDHSKQFAEWYIQNIFPLVRIGCPISIHDIFLRRRLYGEITIILNWIKKYNVNFISPSQFAPNNLKNELLIARKKIGLRQYIHHNTVNSDIFFLMPEIV